MTSQPEAKTIRVGVIGCGLIAQTMHLPILRELPDTAVEAVCDVSKGTAEAVARHFGADRVYQSAQDLLADDGIDAVAILTYDHGQLIIDALKAGKHVLVEKPLAFTPDEALPILDVAEASDRIAQLGYMKLYDPGVEYAVDWMKEAGEPRSVRVHDFGGRADALHRHDLRPLRVDDLSPAELEQASKFSAHVEQKIAVALGPSHAGYADLLSKVLMLGCHDLAVLRTVVGRPERVLFAMPVSERRALAVLELANGAPCTFEVGVGIHHEWWDEYLAVYTDYAELHVEFGNPFYPYQPTEVRIKEGNAGIPSVRTQRASLEFGFRREWLSFIDCVRTGERSRSTLRDGLQDIELALAIARAMPPRPA